MSNLMTRIFGNRHEESATASPPAAAPPPVAAPSPVAPRSGYVEHDDEGTLQDTLSKAMAYWSVRMTHEKKDPFVLSVFDHEQDARAALLDLPCIHVADDTGRLICTEVLIYGYYPTEDGRFEAIVCGEDMTPELFRQAHDSFARHGGTLKNELEPAGEPTMPATEVGDASRVVYVREDHQNSPYGALMTYRIYRAPDAASAKAYLEDHPVTQPLVYIVIETPEGNYCRDIQGMYKE